MMEHQPESREKRVFVFGIVVGFLVCLLMILMVRLLF